jgi:hypothetical protein
MASRRWTLLVGLISVSVLVMLSLSPRGAGSGRLGEAELASIRGLGPECQWGWIDPCNYVTDCLWRAGGYDNDCDALGCVGSSGNCGSGLLYSGFFPPLYVVYAVGSCDEYLKTDTPIGCYYNVDCNTGSLQSDKNCRSRACREPLPGAPTVGCKDCSLGAEYPVTLVSKVFPEMVECPCKNEL